MFSFSVAGHQGEGFSFTEGKSAEDFGVECGGVLACQETSMERSKLLVREMSAQVNYTFRQGFQIFLGAGNRQVTGTPYYHIFTAAPAPNPKGEIHDSWERYNAPKWKIDTQFYLFGLRGTTL
jgi:hypothetical protein